MALAFLSSATGNPINLKRRLAFQSTRGLPPLEQRGGGILTFSGVVSDTETVTIGSDVYEFDADSSVTGGNIAVDVSGGVTAADAVTALVAAINASATEAVTAVDGNANSVVVYTDASGLTTDGTTTTCANATWADVTLVGDAEDPYIDFRCYGGPVVIEPSEVDRMALSGSAAPLSALPGKVSLSGGPLEIGDADPANKGMLRLLANAFGAYTTTSAGGATYYTHDFKLTGSTTPSSFLSLVNDNDVLPRARFFDMLTGGFNISAAPNSNLSVSFPFALGEYDFHGIPYQLAGSGGTAPRLKRTWSGNWIADATDKDIYAKAVTDNGATWVFNFKVGAAASYSQAVTVTEGQWCRIKDESGNLCGYVGESVMFYIPSGWDGSANDEFVFPKRRAAQAQSLTTERPIAAVDTIFVLDGVEKRVEGGWDIAGEWESLDTFEDTAGRQGATVERSGQFNVTITPTRRIIDLDLQYAIHEATNVALYIDCYTRGTISGTSPLRPYRMLFAAPSCKVFGPLFGTEPGGRNREESPRIVCAVPASAGSYTGPYDSSALTFASHFHVWVENDLSSF